MTEQPIFNRDFSPRHGVIEQIAPGIRRVTAPNPGAFTFTGTGTYIIGEGRVAVIDPGPNEAAHVEALLGALAGETITHLLITHTHLDHSPASVPVQAATGAATYGFGPHGSGRFVGGEAITVEAGGDQDFVPDHRLGDGDIVSGDGWSVERVHTPGHTSNHLCFAVTLQGGRALFPGDHVMGWSTTVVSPPDGDMKDYVASLEKLLAREDGAYYPTHGAPIAEPKPFLRALIAHRRAREDQIIACITNGRGRIADMVTVIYPGLDAALVPAARCSTFAAIVKMAGEGRVACDGELAIGARFGIGD